MASLRRKILSEADRAEWAAYAQAIKAMPGRDAPMPPAPSAPATPAAAPRKARTKPAPATLAPADDLADWYKAFQVPSLRPRAANAKPTAVAVGEHPAGLDKASWNRFRTGKLTATRTLDLHGRTAQRAHHALQAFLQAAHAEGVRCVEIITGRGAGEAGGVLKRELPHWLNQPELRHLVLAASHPHAANSGSVRVLLRRSAREKPR